MQLVYEDTSRPRSLTALEIDQVGGAGTFGEWVGRIGVWSSPVGLVADVISGGALSNAAAGAVGGLEDWVNGK